MRLAPGVHLPRVALILLLLLAVLASCASGTTYFVNTTSTTLSACAPTSLCDGCLQCPSIRSALSVVADNDQVYLLPGEYTGLNNTNICMGYLCEFKNVSLAGYGRPEDIVISGLSNPSSEFPRGVNVTLDTFSVISNITFVGLRCDSAQSDILSQRVVDVAGAAMLIVGSNVALRNLIFSNNSALSGGAIAVYRSEVQLVGLTLENNAATSLGGAVLLVSSNATITSSIFERNNVSSTLTQDLTGAGGALYFSGTEDQYLFITNCVFKNNTAQRSGGAMHLQPAGLFTGKGAVKVEATIFSDNLLVGLSTCLTTSSCNSMGGAVYISANDATFNNCSFTNNYAMVTSSATDIGQGGAIFSTTVYVFKAKSLLAMSSTNFSHNLAAGAGGALYISNQNYVMESCYFYENLAFTMDPLFSTVASQGGAVWFSNGALQGRMINVVFEKNMARSGWGGAIYGTASSQLTVVNSRFSENSAVSSYSNAALGGAVMVTNQVQLNLTSTLFEGNHARPNYTTIPLTYSGSGGAIFAQSAGVSFSFCEFSGNSAYTGQFDSGSTGGAIVIEDCEPMTISNCLFSENYASGYVGSSSYASSGNGGALYVKFSVANINHCQFIRNWVSAGGVSNSLGGAVAAFFDYSSVASSSQGVQINNTAFINNTAYGQLCSSLQAGTAGAIGFVGVTTPPVQLRDVVFAGNMAVRTANNQGVSLGGAVSVSLSSQVYMYNARFSNNFALYGVGNDLISITASNDDSNYIYLNEAQFDGVATTLAQRIKDISNATHLLCEELNQFIETFDDVAAQPLSRLQRKLGTQLSAPILGRWISWSSNQSLHDVVARLTPETSSTEFNYTLWWSLRDKLLSDTERVSRALAVTPSITQNDLMNFMPGIALTAGSSTFELCRFSSSYHIFVGNYGSLLSGQSSSEDLSATTECELQVIGNISSADLVLTLVEASVVVDLYNASDTITVSQVNIFNGSLIFSNDVFVTESSFLFAASLKGASSRFHNSSERPVAITFLSDILTGYSIMQVTGSSLSVIQMIHRRIGNITTNASAQSVLVFDACDVQISGAIYLDSPYRGINIVSNLSDNAHPFSNCKMQLRNNATINIAESGSMVLFTSTSIVADHYSLPAILNSGRISLLGASASPFQRGALASLDDIGSLSSVLTVNGQFVQNASGQVHLVLNTSGQNIPVINLIDNTLIGGMINVTFHDDPSLVLYDTDQPTAFTIISYTNTSQLSATTVTPTIIAPTGLAFTDKLSYATPSKQYQQQLIVSNIACDQINYDYQGVKSSLNVNLYPCYVCLKNSSCVLCEDSSGAQYCAGSGMCGAGKTVYSSQCCATNCNPPYGSCQGKDGNTKFQCECSTWFYGGTECDQLSLAAIIVIFTGTFLVTTALLSTFLYRRSVTQKQQVLEELREGILRHTESANNEYILNMQQALILNDVFVKFDEIKLESKVGEGSYGVVHKATFRGAQVAVKQMRSMFFELTDKEIEEFRREAYVMSRLRHPNIVLVMGISLVDQEPVAFPKTRTLNSIEDWDQANDKKKSKPQKTVCIITEFLEQGSLADILYGPTRLPAEIWTYELILACALQAARGMLYLHSHQPPICHRDLKSSNLVVDDHWVVKVTDFGMSRIVPEKVQEMDKGVGDDERESIGRDSVGDFSRHEAGSIMVTPSSGTNSASRKTGSLPSSNSQFRSSLTAPEMTSNMGTTAWCAPEILTASNRTRYSVKVDVYSFGMVLWELWEKKRPFEEYSSRFDIVDAVRAGKRPIISDNCPPAYKALIQRCWHTEPSRRPMFHYIVRYLKDELGRVKRQKALPVGGAKPSMYVRPSDTSSGAVPSQPPPFHASTAVQVIPPAAMRRTLHTGVADEEGGGGQVDDRQPRRLNVVADTISPMHAAKAEGPVMETQPGVDPSHTADADVPQGRTPLVKAFDRSLSYLTESPGLDSPVLARHLHDQPGVAHLGPSSRASNTWRDRYVMRFSGWNSAKPDTGLPPSLIAPAPPATNMAPQSHAAPPAVTATGLDSGETMQDRQESSSPSQGPAIFTFDPEQTETTGQGRS